MANRFDTASQVGVEARLQDQRRSEGRVLPDLNMAAPLDVHARLSRRIVAEIAKEDQEIRAGVLISELPPTQTIDAASTEAVHVFGEVEDTLATKIASDPELHRKLQAVTSPIEAQAWVRAERDEGEAPAVIRRQKRKAWKRHVTPVSALDADLRASEQDLVEPTPYVHAERALGQTGRFVRKHGGVVGRRPDHGTLANDPDEHYKDGSAKKAVVDDIDLAAAQLNESFGADYAVREEDSQEVDVFTLCQEQSRDVIVAMGAIVDLEQELIEEGGFHIVKINPIKYRSLGDSAQDDL